MQTILVRAAFLQPGAVLAATDPHPRRVFIRFSGAAWPSSSGAPVALITADPEAPPQPITGPEVVDADTPLAVEVADDYLAPRELDLLAEVARMQLSLGLDPERQAALEKLLNRVRPVAPTIEELAQALADARNGGGCGVIRGQEIDALVERARAAGVLPRA